MSLKSWKEEFITQSGSLVQDGINKWIGFRQENLNKHGVYVRPGNDKIVDKNTLEEFSVDKCSLCDEFFSGKIRPCENCPLHLCRQRTSCDVAMDFEPESPYESAVS